jgi:hypothetical protein
VCVRCACMCVHTCTKTHLHAHTHTHTHTHTHAHAHIKTHLRVRAHTQTHTDTHTHTHTHTHIRDTSAEVFDHESERVFDMMEVFSFFIFSLYYVNDEQPKFFQVKTTIVIDSKRSQYSTYLIFSNTNTVLT